MEESCRDNPKATYMDWCWLVLGPTGFNFWSVRNFKKNYPDETMAATYFDHKSLELLHYHQLNTTIIIIIIIIIIIVNTKKWNHRGACVIQTIQNNLYSRMEMPWCIGRKYLCRCLKVCTYPTLKIQNAQFRTNHCLYESSKWVSQVCI